MLQAFQGLVLGSQLLLVADKVPELKVEPSCRAAIQANVGAANRNENACLQDEKAAKTALQKEWGQFSAGQEGPLPSATASGGKPELCRATHVR